MPFSAQAVEAYLEKKQANFKGGLAGDEAKQRRAALMRLPFAGGSVAAVTEDMVVAALKALPPVQMHRVREWLAGSSKGTGVFKLAAANKWRTDNPAECQDRLPDRPKKKQRMPAMAWKDVPALMSKLREIDSDAARASLMSTVLTAPRSGMTTGATWSEITTNGDGDVWEVLGTRMKVDEDWCTPLAPQVIEILGKQGKREADALLFNLKSNEMLKLLQSFGYTDPKSARGGARFAQHVPGSVRRQRLSPRARGDVARARGRRCD